MINLGPEVQLFSVTTEIVPGNLPTMDLVLHRTVPVVTQTHMYSDHVRRLAQSARSRTDAAKNAAV